MMAFEGWRCRAVLWLYAMGSLHLLAGCLLAWGNPGWFQFYDALVLQEFALEHSAQSFQAWWMSIFGTTLQAFSIAFLGLVYCGNKYKSPQAWLFLIAALLIWAPQDIYFSVIKNIWINLWVDLLAVTSLLPALIYCYFCDRRK